MLSEKRRKCLKVLGLEVPVVQGSTMEKVVEGSTMKRHTKIPIAGNTESQLNHKQLLRKIARYKQLGIPILVEFTAELARNAALKAKSNVVPRIGKGKDRMHGLESGATMPRIGKVKYRTHGLESGATTGLSGSTQGREQPLGKSHTENPERAIPRSRQTKLVEPSAVVRVKLRGME